MCHQSEKINRHLFTLFLNHQLYSLLDQLAKITNLKNLIQIYFQLYEWEVSVREGALHVTKCMAWVLSFKWPKRW